MAALSKRIVVLVIVCAVATLAASGCAADRSAAPKSAPAPAPAVVLRVSGSGTSMPLLRILADAYPDKDVDFVFLPGLHSGGGIKGVASGDLDIGGVSRELTDDEKKAGLEYAVLSADGLAMAVHPSVTISNITRQQVKDIYAGKYANWKELGGPDLPIVILDRNEDESAKIILRKYVIDEVPISPKAVNLFYEPDMIEALTRTVGAIGYFSSGTAFSEKVEARLLALDGVEPSLANIHSGTYAVIRPLGTVVAKDAPRAAADFVTWATGPDAVPIMEGQGFAAASAAPAN